MNAKFIEGKIDQNPLTPLVDNSGWCHERSRPRCVPSASLVKSYYNACETHTEQVVVLLLAGIGLRTGDPKDENTDELFNFDSKTPHIAFSSERKNGVGRVPIVIGAGVIKNYLSRLRRDPEYGGALFPSDDSDCGCRSTEWIRNTIERIGERTDATLKNGEKPTPKDFRQFWYTQFLNAWNEFLEAAERVGDIQGSSMPESVTTYAGDDSWFNIYLSQVEPIMEEAFPADMEQTIADDLGRVDVDPRDNMQSKITEYDDNILSAASGPQGYFAAAIAIPSRIAVNMTATWTATKHRALSVHPGIDYPMSWRQYGGLLGGWLLLAITSSVVMHATGQIDFLMDRNLLLLVLLLVLVYYTKYIVDKDTPTIEQAKKVANEHDT
jgi:hypothetical protein